MYNFLHFRIQDIYYIDIYYKISIDKKKKINHCVIHNEKYY